MTKLTKGSRVATIEKQSDGKFRVYCGFSGTACPGDEIIPSRWFDGTCSRSYKRESAAVKAASAFLND